MSTGVETWVDVATLGPVYPFVGSEMFLFIVCLAVWIGWHILQLRAEAKEFSVENKELSDKARNARVLDKDH